MAAPWEKYGQAAPAPTAAPTDDPIIRRAPTPPPKNPYDIETDQRDFGNKVENQDFSNAARMRDDWNALPQIKSYRVAIQQLDQALNTGDGPQSDLALTYAFAKAMDPESVVRDSEQGMQSNSQPWFQAQVERAKKEFGMDGAGVFTPEARAALRQQIISSVASRRQNYGQLRGYHSELAGRYGFDPFEVVGVDDGDAYLKRLQAYDEKRKGRSAEQSGERSDAGLTSGDGPPEDQHLIGYGKNPDGTEYPMYGPMQLTPDEQQALALEGEPGIGTLAKHGIALGMSDEAAGIGGAIAGIFTGKDPVTEYERNNRLQDMQIERARANSPVAGTIAEILGGGGAARIASMAPTIAGAARQGAALGGIGGYGYGEGATGSSLNAMLGAAGGAALGAGAQYGLNALAGRGAAPRGAQPDMDVIAAGQRQNIPIRQPDARPELRGQYGAVGATERGGPMVRQAMNEDVAAIEGRVAEVGGPGNASDPYALGTRAQEAGTRYIDRTRVQKNDFYGKADQLASGQRVKPQNAIAAIDQNIAELESTGANTNAATIKYLRELRDDMSKPEGFSITEFQGLRSGASKKIKGDQALTSSDADRRLGAVTSAFTSDAEAQLPRAAVGALKKADQFYAQRQGFINSVLKEFMGTRGSPLNAETAATRLASMAQGKGNFDKFSRMWGQLNPDEQADLAATVASTLGRKGNGEFSVSTLMTSLDPRKGINPRTARLIFGDDGAAALNDLRIISKAKVDAASEQNVSKTGNALNRAAGGLKNLFLAALGFTQGGPAGAVAAPVAGQFLKNLGDERAARLLLNPDFTKWLKNAPNTTNPKVIDRYFEKLAGMSSVAANDNKAFVSAIREAFSKSPVSSAAREQEQDGRRVPPK